MEHTPVTVTVIIPVHNQIDYLRSCILSLKKAANNTNFEILVIDDYSSHESVIEMSKLSGFRLIRNYENLGFLRTCNRAALNTTSQYIFFLNSDTEVTDGWLDELIDVFSRFENVGLVGSKLVYPDNTLQECGGIVWKDGSAWNYGRNEDPHLPQYNYTKETDYVSGAAILIERELFLSCGMFDTRYKPAYYEDTDLAFKVRSAGMKVFVEPKSVVIHHEGKSNGTDTGSGIKRYQIRNGRIFLNKWRHVLQKEHFRNAENVLRARDRSTKCKKILVIDHYVPKHDRDAGSRCIYMHLKLLKSMGFSVTFFTDNFYQDPVYTPDIERMGIEILYGVHYLKNHRSWLEENLNQFDYVFLSRPHISIKYIDLIKKQTRAKTIYFGHDIHHVRMKLEKDFNPDISYEDILLTEKQEIDLWNECDYLLYPSSEEVEIISQAGFSEKAIEVPIYFYPENEEANRLPFEQAQDFLFVGNFNHPPNLDAIKWFISEIFPMILKALPNARLKIVGSAIPNEIKSLESDKLSIDTDVTDEELKNHYKQSRVSVVPLRFGAGVKGKVLESMFYQLPVVTTSFGAQGIPEIEKCAHITNDAEIFAKHCIELYTRRDTWNSYSNRSRVVLLKKYSMSNAENIFSSITKSH
ncbi:glycosyltransferase [Pelagicoccus albus]|uniref:Glycosyltransferase n=1 Tax=Pelagicoccus albus TaxID=415222 RepID=A0A7X1BA57_9BACT|nr:glycosyltransferase [Pelagicoccus albus]MBC2607228.1 glycosyltransferase [Pelagicoccus albus]